MMTQCPNCQKEIPVSSRHWGKWGCDSCKPFKWRQVIVPSVFIILVLASIYHALGRRLEDQGRLNHELQDLRQEVQQLRQEIQQLKNERQKR